MDDLISRSELSTQLEGFKLSLGDVILGFVVDRVIERVKAMPAAEVVHPTEYDGIIYKLECLLCHATGGKFSKAGYALEDMERMVTDYVEECCQEAIAEQVTPCEKCGYYAFGRCKFWDAEIHPDNFCSFGERRGP